MKYKRMTERVGKSIAIRETSTNDNKSIWNAIERLAELEDKIENGTLVELPCKVGDTIYWLTSNNEIVEAVVSRIRINKYGVVFDVFEGGCEYSMFNTEFFKTKAEAEQKLKELENERD